MSKEKRFAGCFPIRIDVFTLSSFEMEEARANKEDPFSRASRFPFHCLWMFQLHVSHAVPLITTRHDRTCTCPAFVQWIFQGEREGEGARWLSQAQGETADRGRSQGLPRLDNASRGHRAGNRWAEAGWKKYVYVRFCRPKASGDERVR